MWVTSCPRPRHNHITELLEVSPYISDLVLSSSIIFPTVGCAVCAILSYGHEILASAHFFTNSIVYCIRRYIVFSTSILYSHVFNMYIIPCVLLRTLWVIPNKAVEYDGLPTISHMLKTCSSPGDIWCRCNSFSFFLLLLFHYFCYYHEYCYLISTTEQSLQLNRDYKLYLQQHVVLSGELK